MELYPFADYLYNIVGIKTPGIKQSLLPDLLEYWDEYESRYIQFCNENGYDWENIGEIET